MRTIYLDQNKWIDLARARVRSDVDRGLRAALETVDDHVRRAEWIVPVSSTHHIEMANIGNRRRRFELGETMWELSRGWTMAPYAAIVRHELDQVLQARFPTIQPRPFQLLGKGVAHAFGQSDLRYRVPGVVRHRFPVAFVEALEAQGTEIIERAVLTGQTPDGSPPPAVDLSGFDVNFMDHLDELPSTLEDLPRSRWHDALVAMSLVDIRDAVSEALQHHDITWDQLIQAGKDELTRLVLDLPSRSLDLHMHWQVAKNPALKPKRTDLNDWGSLIPAAVYCDILVCEKHFADLMQRDGYVVRAEVFTDIRALAN